MIIRYLFAEIKDNLYRKEQLDLYNDSSKGKRIGINLKLLYQMYFGEEILSYFHPSNKQRIEWLEVGKQ